MIGWHITKGYETGYTTCDESGWNKIQELAEGILVSQLTGEALDLRANVLPDELCAQIAEVAKTYKSEIYSPLHIGDDEIMILAGGGGVFRAAKEHVARAFVRILMREVHQRGFDISVSVA